MDWEEQQKTVTFIAPTLGSTAYFVSALQLANIDLKKIEEFNERSGDPTVASRLREAQYTIQSIIDGVHTASQITLEEIRNYQSQQAQQEVANSNFGASFGGDIIDLGPEDNNEK